MFSNQLGFRTSALMRFGPTLVSKNNTIGCIHNEFNPIEPETF